MQDGLGSVRNNALSYSPFGVPDAAMTGFAFTGEVRDANGLQFHRARYYSPELGVFPSVDPFEGVVGQAMSLNGYSWVEGRVPSAVDPTGLVTSPATILNTVTCTPNLQLQSRCSGPYNSPIQNEQKREAGCCDDPSVTYEERIQMGCAEEICIERCWSAGDFDLGMGITLPIGARARANSCMASCLEDQALQNTDAHQCRIEMYSYNTDYTGGSGDPSMKNAYSWIQPNHSFVVFWDDSGPDEAYYGTPVGSPINLDWPYWCGGYIGAGTQPIYIPNGQLDTVLEELAEGRGTGPHILLGGSEACSVRDCLSARMDEIKDLIEPDPSDPTRNGVLYCPLNRNSNSIAFGLLKSCGVPVVIPDVALPGAESNFFVK